jgi:hypothetical protein
VTDYRRRGLLVATFAGILAVAAISSGASGAPMTKAPDVQLAIRSPMGTCGTFADTLPALVTATDVAADTTIADLSICIRNAGTADGVLAFGADELQDIDTGCTGDENTVDASCGGGSVGELSARLIQRIGTNDCRGVPATTPTWDRSLAQFAASPVVLTTRLMKGKQLCAHLVMRYEPTAASAVGAQSDRATWRYAFTLTSS